MATLFSKAMIGFELACRSRGLSDNTLRSYLSAFRKLQNFQGDLEVDQITKQNIETFLSQQKVSNKSRLNYHIAFSSLWSWMRAEDLVEDHIMKQVKRPKPEIRAIIPFTDKEIRNLFSHIGSKDLRNKAIMLLLLDTGLRASELCGLTTGDLDLKGRSLKILGKGNKERRVVFGDRTGNALWKYLNTRGELLARDTVFVTRNNHPLDREGLAGFLRGLGARSDVLNCHPHRFRHTFAISYLRNGGDVFTLQAMLGHANLEMSRKYLALAAMDMDQAHRKASPVENLRL